MIGFLQPFARRVFHRFKQRTPATSAKTGQADSAPPPLPFSGAVSVKGVRADLRSAHWEDGTLVVEGWVTIGGKKRHAPSSLSIWAVPLDGGEDAAGGRAEQEAPPIRLSTAEATHLNPNGFVTSDHDLTASTFSAYLTSDVWDSTGSSNLQIAVQCGESDELTPFTHRYRWGSAGHLFAHISEGKRYAPRWHPHHGLCVRRSSPSAFTYKSPSREGNSLKLSLELSDGFYPVRADWTDEAEPCSVSLSLNVKPGLAPEIVVSGTNTPLPDTAWGIALTDEHGTRRLVHWGDSTWDSVELDDFTRFERRSGGLVRLVGGPRRIVLDDIVATESEVVATLSPTSQPDVTSLSLRGSRMTIHGHNLGKGRFTFPLATLSWREKVEVFPSGGYRLWATDKEGAEVRVTPGTRFSQKTPARRLTARAAFRFEHAPDGQVYVDVSAPLHDDEQGRFHRRRLATAFTGDNQGSDSEDLEGVFLESWYGKTFSDNPAPLVEALRTVGVPGPYRVAIADHSVEHPADVEAVIVGSENYWRAMGSSRVLIFNTWLPNEFVKRRGQFIVQTWHGTPLKSLGMDVPERKGSTRAAENLRRGSREWDLLVSQNAYSTEVLRRAYVYDGEIAETGYPRNDILIGRQGEETRARTRQLLGVPENTAVILYAPTWRQADKGSVGPLNIKQFAELLSPNQVIAVRGHSVTLRRGNDLMGDRVVDVTSYPEPAELMAAADVLVTDYSSIMFDFATTGKPIVFFTPDYTEYMSEGRGGYFDLVETAPGPFTHTPEQLAAALNDALSVPQTATAQYREWQKKFVPHDDGTAADRLARRIVSALS